MQWHPSEPQQVSGVVLMLTSWFWKPTWEYKRSGQRRQSWEIKQTWRTSTTDSDAVGYRDRFCSYSNKDDVVGRQTGWPVEWMASPETEPHRDSTGFITVHGAGPTGDTLTRKQSWPFSHIIHKEDRFQTHHRWIQKANQRSFREKQSGASSRS